MRKRPLAKKYDAQKPRPTLIPVKALRAATAALEYGAAKYSVGGWKTLPDGRKRYSDALYRHFLSYLEDPNGVDEESGLPHIAHVLVNAMFLNEDWK